MNAADPHVVTTDAVGIARSTSMAIRASSPASFGTWRKSMGLIIALVAALVALGDVFFHAVPVGWTCGLYALAMAAAMTLRSSAYLRSWRGRIALAVLVALCVSLIEQPGPLRITMTLIALMSIAAMNRHGWSASATAWLYRWIESTSRLVTQLPVDVFLMNRWTRSHGGRGAKTMRIAMNWALPALLSLVFVWLFTLANPVISRWIEQAISSVSRTLTGFFEVVTFARLLLWLGLGFGVWSLLRGCVRWPGSRHGIPQQAASKAMFARGQSAHALLLRCLILFNIVFAVQLGLDLAMVLSNGALLPEGMDYRTYARRGAYPLVATALLAAAFVIVSFPSGKEAEAAIQDSVALRWARRLVCVWIAQNIVLTLTAIWRLWMYVEALGLTRLRIAAAIWMLVVALGLMAIIWRIIQHRSNAWLVRANMVTLIATLTACCFVNFDSKIAWHDVQRCAENGGLGPSLDRAYLRSLGPEAIEPFQWLETRASNRDFAALLTSDATMLQSRLHSDMRTWQGWTWRRSSIAGAIHD